MNVKELRTVLADLPDDMPVVVDDGSFCETDLAQVLTRGADQIWRGPDGERHFDRVPVGDNITAVFCVFG